VCVCVCCIRDVGVKIDGVRERPKEMCMRESERACERESDRGRKRASEIVCVGKSKRVSVCVDREILFVCVCGCVCVYVYIRKRK